MTLYEIDRAMLECIDEGTGEIDEERLNRLQLQRNDKIENMALWVKDLRAEASALENEIHVLQERREKALHKADSLIRYITKALDGHKFKTVRVTIYYRKSKFVQVDEGARLPEKYLRIRKEPDKTAIKESLNNGIMIDGCRIIENQNMIVR